MFENIVFVVKQCDVYGSEVQGEVHRAGSILRIGSGSGLGVHNIPIRDQKRGLGAGLGWLDNSNSSHCICEIEKLLINIHIDIRHSLRLNAEVVARA